jgi:hypothetical protein
MACRYCYETGESIDPVEPNYIMIKLKQGTQIMCIFVEKKKE